MTATHKSFTPRFKRSSQADSPLAPLAPHWAFVVQLRQGTALTAKQMQGRIEHVVSGQATTFTCLEDARAFMERVLAEMEAEKPP